MKYEKIITICLLLLDKIISFFKYFYIKKNIEDVKKDYKKEWHKWK